MTHLTGLCITYNHVFILPYITQPQTTELIWFENIIQIWTCLKHDKWGKEIELVWPCKTIYVKFKVWISKQHGHIQWSIYNNIPSPSKPSQKPKFYIRNILYYSIFKFNPHKKQYNFNKPAIHKFRSKIFFKFKFLPIFSRQSQAQRL